MAQLRQMFGEGRGLKIVDELVKGLDGALTRSLDTRDRFGIDVPIQRRATTKASRGRGLHRPTESQMAMFGWTDPKMPARSKFWKKA